MKMNDFDKGFDNLDQFGSTKSLQTYPKAFKTDKPLKTLGK